MPPLRENPSEFLDETYPAKTRGMGLLYGEKLHDRNLKRFWLIHPCDGRTDGRAIAYARYSIYALARKNVAMKVFKIGVI